MAAGIFGYMGYDTVRLMEHLPTPKPDALGVPDAIFIRPTVMVVFDAVKDEITVVTPVRPEPGIDARRRPMRRALGAPARRRRTRSTSRCRTRPAMSGVELALPDAVSNTTPAEFKAMVQRAKEYIAAGDIFQVVLSQRFAAPFTLPPFALYRALRRINPSPFLFYLDFGGFALVGSSPEILVRVRDGKVTIRPIAGTRPRGATPEEDQALEAELLADPKERAEHLMLLDLGRNDVGRVAKIGIGARHRQLRHRALQPRHAHRLQRRGRRSTEKHDAVDALMAGFPAGTVSGAPKVRAMEIIDELEKDKRGPYAGCVGYFSADGEMDTCIVLRTALVKDGMMYVQAGAGIVADSDPDAEQQECVNKAKALFRAAEEAVRFAARGKRGNRPS